MQPGSSCPDVGAGDDVPDEEDPVVGSPQGDVAGRVPWRLEHREVSDGVTLVQGATRLGPRPGQQERLQVVDDVRWLPRAGIPSAQCFGVTVPAPDPHPESVGHRAARPLGRWVHVSEHMGVQPTRRDVSEQSASPQPGGAVDEHIADQVGVGIHPPSWQPPHVLGDLDPPRQFRYAPHMDTYRIPVGTPGTTVAVTGVTGRLGGAIARYLLAAGHDVVGLVRRQSVARAPEGVTVRIGDVRDEGACASCFGGAEVVFNAMGIPEQWRADAGAFEAVNAAGTATVVDTCRRNGVRRLVHVSTIDVFEPRQGRSFCEDDVALAPRKSPYQRSKQRAEAIVLDSAANGALEVVVTNLAGLLGGDVRPPSLENDLLIPLLSGRLPFLPPGGLNLIAADSAAAGIVLAANRGTSGSRYILSDGYLTVRQMAALVLETAGRSRVPRSLPPWVARALARAAEARSRRTRQPPLLSSGQLDLLLWGAVADATRARTALGWAPRPLRDTVSSIGRDLVGMVRP